MKHLKCWMARGLLAATTLGGCVSRPGHDGASMPIDCQQQLDDYRDYGATQGSRRGKREDPPSSLRYENMVEPDCRRPMQGRAD